MERGIGSTDQPESTNRTRSLSHAAVQASSISPPGDREHGFLGLVNVR